MLIHSWEIIEHIQKDPALASGDGQGWKKKDQKKCTGLSRWPQYREVSQFSSVAQSCLILCDPMDCSKPGLPVHHQFLEFAQTHVH